MKSRLSGTLSWVASLGTWRLAAFLTLLAVGKAGIQRSEAVSSYIEHTATTDEFNTYFRTSPILLFVARIFAISDESRWLAVHAIATCGFLIAVVVATRQESIGHSKALLISIVLGPPVTLVLTEIGRYDVFFLLGALGVAVGGPLTGAMSASLMFLSNFEQGIVSSLCVIALAFVSELKFPRRTTFQSLIFGACVSLIVMWQVVGRQEAHDSRFNALWRNLEGAVLANMRSLPFLVFSSLGVLWLPLIATLSTVQKRLSVLLIIASSFGLPMLLTLITLDGMRVFVCISFLPLVILFRHWDYAEELVESRSTLVLLIVAGALLPSLNVYVDGVVKAPYEEIYIFFRG